MWLLVVVVWLADDMVLFRCLTLEFEAFLSCSGAATAAGAGAAAGACGIKLANSPGGATGGGSWKVLGTDCIFSGTGATRGVEEDLEDFLEKTFDNIGCLGSGTTRGASGWGCRPRGVLPGCRRVSRILGSCME